MPTVSDKSKLDEYRYHTFEQFVQGSVKMGEWGGELHIFALSVTCARPVFTYSEDNYHLLGNATNASMRNPIIIHYRSKLFTGVLALNQSASIRKT